MTQDKDRLTTEEEPIEVMEEGPGLPMLFKGDFVDQFEKASLEYKRFQAAMYRLTRAKHWINRGTKEEPKFGLQGPGAEALMNPLGISFDQPKIWREDKADEDGKRYYIIWAEGYMESKTLGRRGWYIGACDSKDQFFRARPGWNPDTGEPDIKKSALTNWIVNGVTRLAGIRDPDPEILMAAGLSPEQIQVIDYSGRPKTPAQAEDVISEPQVKRLFAIMTAKKVSKETVEAHLQKQIGIKLFSQIKKGQYNGICAWVEAGAPAIKEDKNGERQPTLPGD